MIIRPAIEADLPAVLAIYNHAVLHTVATADYEPQTLAQREAWFSEHEQGGYPVFVAEDEGVVVGWIALNKHHPRYGYRFSAEDSVYIAPEAQGRGVGKLLLTRLIEAARSMEVHALLAGMDSNNEASLRLHRSFGFVQVAHYKETIYKFDRWLDVIYLELILE